MAPGSGPVSETVKRLAAIRRAHGDDADGFYVGNPATHNYPATLAALAFARALNTRNVFSTASVDFLPRMFAAYHSFETGRCSRCLMWIGPTSCSSSGPLR
jgi:hypothetical protein